MGGVSALREVPLDRIDTARLVAGDKREWDGFVRSAAPLVHAVVRRVLAAHGAVQQDDVLDGAQDVFVRLSADRFALIRRFDPQRSSLKTWLAVIARSAAIDFLRRRRQPTVSLDEVPEAAAAVEDRHAGQLRIPDGLLTARQALVLQLLYDRDMDVAEVAGFLGVDAQTVRSTHHKALSRLRERFGADSAGQG